MQDTDEAADATVVGRETELAALRSFLGEVEKPASFFLEGEAGIGKTTVWQAAVADAWQRSFQVLSSRPAGSELQLSFASLGDLLAGALAAVGDELPAPQRRALSVALLLDDPRGPPPDPRAIGLGVLGVLRRLSLRNPVLVAIDDAQWLDQPTAGALHFALRRLTHEPIALLVAARPDAVTRAEDVTRAFARDRRFECRLGPLSVAAIQRLLRSRLGIGLARPVLLRVHEASCGNPFYALELAQALGSTDARLQPGRQLPVPGSLLEIVGGRISALPKVAQELVLAAALLADPRVSALRDLQGDRRAAAGLQAAIDAGVLEVDGDRISFTHPLLASTACADAGSDRRKRLHRRLAQLVQNPEAQARHLGLAADGREAEVALALERGAQQALERGAPAAAAELLELAVAATPLEETMDLRRRELQAADAHVAAGAIEQGTTILRSLLDELDSGDARADVLVRLARLSPDLEDALALAQQAHREACSEALRAQARLLLGRGWPMNGMQQTLRHGRAALRHAEASGDRRLLVCVLARLSLYQLWASQNPSGSLDRAIALEERADDLRGYESPRMQLALWRMYQGRLEEARALFGTLYAEAAERGDELDALGVRARLVDVALRGGRWNAADTHASELYELAEQIGHEHTGGLSNYWKALCDAHLGRPEDARAAAETGANFARATKAHNTLVMNLGVLGFLEISLGNEAGALPHLRPFLDWIADTQLGLATHPIAPYALEALAASGQAEEGRKLLGRFEQEARTLGTTWGLAIGARCRAQFAAAEGDPTAALGAVEEALALHGHGEWPFEHARALLVYGRTLRRVKRKSDAKRSLETALGVFEQLPAPLWADLCRAEIDRIGLRRASSGDLTEGERRVAELAASGMTNREVAARLYMSPKTVEANLVRAYRKLGIHSRAELGARLGAGGAAAQT
ncbi:MAG TPA: AAA family ATPase [Gaiellaceae bacterium]|nr:AAA family ATPase [Gaiellaceae bacterium]